MACCRLLVLLSLRAAGALAQSSTSAPATPPRPAPPRPAAPHHPASRPAPPAFQRLESNEAEPPPSSAGCDCMEYWTCIMSGGSPYSYCGLAESMVCCFGAGVKPAAGLVGMTGTPLPAEHLPGASLAERTRCGRKGPDSSPDGEAQPAEWPWHAAILEKPDDLYVCGGSLVDERWILTAAHCVDDYTDRSLKVRLGEYDVTSTHEEQAHEELDVAAVMLYPAFDNATLAHDIALVRLRQAAKRRPHIDVVCLPRQGSAFPRTDGAGEPGARCVLTGWGRRSEVSEHSVVLKEVPVPLWTNSACEAALQQQFGPNYHLPNTSICAGAEGKDACDGDGGGPLVCEESGQWYQVGVISFGIGCGRRNTPGVYTRVNMYEQWIMETVLHYRDSHHQ